MTARLPGDTSNTILTLSAGEEVPWRDARTDALEARRAAILDGARPWGLLETKARETPLRPADPGHGSGSQQLHPRRIDWYRVAAFLIVAVAAILTSIGLWALGVYVLTAF